MQQTDYLVLVNGANRLPEGYEESVERITVQNSFGNEYEVEKKTYEAFLRLQKDLLEKKGIQTELISAYRTIEVQANNFQRHLETCGEEYTNKYVARPGHSEHHTGIAIDVGIVVDGKLRRRIAELLEVDDIFQTVQAALPEYGFILRYPRTRSPSPVSLMSAGTIATSTIPPWPGRSPTRAGASRNTGKTRPEGEIVCVLPLALFATKPIFSVTPP